MTRSDCHSLAMRLLDLDTSTVSGLIRDRGSEKLARQERIAAVHEFARNEIGFGNHRVEDIPASEVLAEGCGQCNIKRIVLMALPNHIQKETQSAT